MRQCIEPKHEVARLKNIVPPEARCRCDFRSLHLPVAARLLLTLMASAVLSDRAGATCPEFPPPPNPVLQALDGVVLTVIEVPNPDAPHARVFASRLPDGTAIPRLILHFPDGTEALEAHVLTTLAPGGAGVALFGDYVETMVVCGIAGGMRHYRLTVTGIAPQ